MIIHEIARRLIERFRLHRDILHLEAYDDRMLADMGVDRETLVDRVRGRDPRCG